MWFNAFLLLYTIYKRKEKSKTKKKEELVHADGAADSGKGICRLLSGGGRGLLNVLVAAERERELHASMAVSSDSLVQREMSPPSLAAFKCPFLL